MNSGVYRIHNLVSGKFYIGSTNDFTARFYNHFSYLRRGKHHSPILQRSFNKHGESAFIVGIIEYCSPEECVAREQIYLDLWKPEYNIAKSASQPALGRQLSDESKAKIGKANSVNRMTPEHFKKFREASEKFMSEHHPMRNKTHKKDSKLKMRESRLKYLQDLKNKGLPLPGPKVGSSWSQARRDAQLRKVR